MAKSGGAGDYRVSLLPPGAYQVSVSAGGFQTTQLNVTVRVGQITNGNLKLSLAQASQSVQVEGDETPLLQTENSDLSTTFTMEQVQNLPNPGGDITYPVQTTQGVVMNTQGGYGNSSAFGLPAILKQLHRERRGRQRSFSEPEQFRSQQFASGPQ